LSIVLPCAQRFARFPFHALPALAGVLGAFASSPLLASEQLAQVGGAALEAVFVTATRTEIPVERTLADVTVIDSKAIRDAGAATLPELLRSAGGIEISQNGGPGSVSGLFVRGTRTAQTLILVDGIRIENPASGGGLPEFLPLSAIDRIEVVRAPTSALYGSAAVGGVVQIFTRQPEGDGIVPFASAGFGSYGTRHLQAGFSGRAGDTGFAMSLAQQKTDGFDATLPSSPDRQDDRDGNRVDSLTASLTHRISADWRFGANLLVSDGRNEYDDAFSTPDTAKMDYRSTAVSAFVTGRFVPDWESTLRVGNSSIDYSFAAFTFAPQTDSRTLSWQNTIDAAGSRWLFGLESLAQQIDGEGLTRGDYVYARDARDTDSVFGGWERAFGAHQLRLVVRRDRIEAVGSETTGSAGWGWQATRDWLLRAGWGSAFRAPTFDDLYNPWSPNPTLRPEKSNGVELAAEWRRDGDLFKATAFSNRIRDAIELDESFTPQNLEVAKVLGITFEGYRQLGDYFVRGSATFQNPEAERTDPLTGITSTSDLSRRAHRYASVGAGWRSGPWRLGADAIAQDERIDTTGVRMGGYAFVDLWAGYRIDRRWELFARLGNIADRQYETAAGYRAAPRSLFAGVRYDAR
jgi:vitamin B12 transporter